MLVALVDVKELLRADQALETDVSVFFLREERGWSLVLLTDHFD